MPIRYRCPDCNQLLSIATRMVGLQVDCPKCGRPTTVPPRDDFAPSPSPPSEPLPPEPGSEPAYVPSESPPPQSAAPIEFSEYRPEEPDRGQSGATLHEVPEPSDVEAGRDPVHSEAAASAQGSDPDDPGDAESGGGASEGGFAFGRRGLDTEEMDLTPMVDMTFLLLIFFMITASFSLQKTIEVPPPSPEQQGAAQTVHSLDELENNSVIVRIDERNTIFVDEDQVADRTRLTQALRSTMRATARNELVVSAADGAFHETVITVIDAANEAGMQKIRLATHGTN